MRGEMTCNIYYIFSVLCAASCLHTTASAPRLTTPLRTLPYLIKHSPPPPLSLTRHLSSPSLTTPSPSLIPPPLSLTHQPPLSLSPSSPPTPPPPPQVSLRRLPPVLCLHVKRFQHMGRRSQALKLDTHVAFHATLDLSPLVAPRVRAAAMGVGGGSGTGEGGGGGGVGVRGDG